MIGPDSTYILPIVSLATVPMTRFGEFTRAKCRVLGEIHTLIIGNSLLNESAESQTCDNDQCGQRGDDSE